MKIYLSFLFTILSIKVYCQTDSICIMKPTGKYQVGTMIYEWIDSTRLSCYSPHQNEKRTLVVQVWYPAKVDENTPAAPYAINSSVYKKVISHSYLRASFTDQLEKAKLILISPGRGTERFLYTTIIEELASQGYFVASVDMPGIGYTSYHDGFIIKPSSAFSPPSGMMAGPYEKVDEFFEQPTEIGYQDLTFALSKIVALNQSDINGRFVGKIDTENIGVFAHSLGGRIAGEFTAKTQNVKAYISMEGIPPRNVRYNGEINIPIAMLCSSGTLPYAIKNYNSLTDNRSNTVYMIELTGFGHNSVTDEPFIFPEKYDYKIAPDKALKITRSLVSNYFESYLSGKGTFLESIEGLENMKTEVYE